MTAPRSHVPDCLRSRDTTTGELLWTRRARPARRPDCTGTATASSSLPRGGVPGVAREAVIVLDAVTGDVIDDCAHHDRPRLRRVSGTVPPMSETTPLSVFEPAGEAKGGLVVIQEIFGVNDHIEDVCRRLADEGWLAVAPHLFHRTRRSEARLRRHDEVTLARPGLTADGVMADVDAALAHIAEAGVPPSRTGIVGFCMGGTRRPGRRGAPRPRRGGDVLRRRRHRGPLRLRGARRGGARAAGAVARAVRRPGPRGIPVAGVEELRIAAATSGQPTEIVRYPDAGHGFNCDQRRATTSPRPPTRGGAWASGSIITSSEQPARPEIGGSSTAVHLTSIGGFAAFRTVAREGGTSTDGGIHDHRDHARQPARLHRRRDRRRRRGEPSPRRSAPSVPGRRRTPHPSGANRRPATTGRSARCATRRPASRCCCSPRGSSTSPTAGPVTRWPTAHRRRAPTTGWPRSGAAGSSTSCATTSGATARRSPIRTAPTTRHAAGGTTNLVFDPHGGEWLESYPSLSGTIRNCCGGPTPWGSWLTCEETTQVNAPGTADEVRHGFVYDVPADGTSDAVPLTQLGRYSHEALCIDPASGIVYLTEDATPSGFYRFVPRRRGDLTDGPPADDGDRRRGRRLRRADRRVVGSQRLGRHRRARTRARARPRPSPRGRRRAAPRSPGARARGSATGGRTSSPPAAARSARARCSSTTRGATSSACCSRRPPRPSSTPPTT